LNGVRVGIAMYGLTPSKEISTILPFRLIEAFSLHTHIVHVKKLNQNEGVSYGLNYKTNKEEWIGTLPIGYADGLRRNLEGEEVLMEGQRVPIVGRICMDQCMIRLPHEVKVGTMITLIGSQLEEKISIDDIAEKLGTINYEIPCMITNRVPRLFRQYGRIIDIHNPLLNNSRPLEACYIRREC
jgi:alanine racemase